MGRERGRGAERRDRKMTSENNFLTSESASKLKGQGEREEKMVDWMI